MKKILLGVVIGVAASFLAYVFVAPVTFCGGPNGMPTPPARPSL